VATILAIQDRETAGTLAIVGVQAAMIVTVLINVARSVRKVNVRCGTSITEPDAPGN
jgi:hypothetical protein